jgi:hypothetical protein
MGDNSWVPDPRAGGEAEYEGGSEPSVDLSALRHGRADSPASAARWEALAARIEAAAGPELARRAAERGTVLDIVPLLARALRPALAAAAAVAMVVGSGVARRAQEARASDGIPEELAAGQLVTPAQVAQALRVDDAEAAWLARGAAPSQEALAEAVGLGGAGEPAP